MLMYKKASWWFWRVIAVFITAGDIGWSSGFYAATILSAVKLIHFFIKEGASRGHA